MSGSQQFWASGAWFFLVYGFLMLAVALIRARRMERRYLRANPPADRTSPEGR